MRLADFYLWMGLAVWAALSAWAFARATRPIAGEVPEVLLRAAAVAVIWPLVAICLALECAYALASGFVTRPRR